MPLAALARFESDHPARPVGFNPGGLLPGEPCLVERADRNLIARHRPPFLQAFPNLRIDLLPDRMAYIPQVDERISP
ncbi:MAG: hypothetical protein ACYDHM_15170 [Acidiferrobacterales bacterium]